MTVSDKSIKIKMIFEPSAMDNYILYLWFFFLFGNYLFYCLHYLDVDF